MFFALLSWFLYLPIFTPPQTDLGLRLLPPFILFFILFLKFLIGMICVNNYAIFDFSTLSFCPCPLSIDFSIFLFFPLSFSFLLASLTKGGQFHCLGLYFEIF